MNQEKRKGFDPRKKTLQCYTEQADAYLAHWDKGAYRTPPLLRELISVLPKNTTILDLGCGPAQDCRYLRRKGLRAVGLDGTWPFLARARRGSERLPLVMGDFAALPFRTDSFDAVWAAASLIHLPKKEVRAVLGVLRNIAKDRGILAATFVHGRGSGYLREGWIPGRYFSFWRKEELIRALGGGWEIVSLKTVSNRERKGRWLNLIARKRQGENL
ncbi:MAG TPA: methyltransferase domain-containing protein [Candidatus Manganitrophaceae bacterium]|nr:methyltransferase domain-containing protein [Candidatus Manganitrophaceae bacterium]